jgi:hypothetical protein
VTFTETSPLVFPLPDNDAFCGLLLAVSEIASVPVCVPVTVGVNVVLIVHLPLAARVALQVLVWAKSPVVAMLEIVTAVLRLLVSVKITGVLVVPKVTLPNPRTVGDNVTGSTPVPVKVAACGLLPAFPLTVKVPVAPPVVLGVNVMLIVHLVPAPSPLPQVLVCPKGTLAAMLEMVSLAVPVLVNVILLTPLVVATTWFPNAKVAGERDTVCPEAVVVIAATPSKRHKDQRLP